MSESESSLGRNWDRGLGAGWEGGGSLTATLIVKMCGKYVGEVTLKFDIIEETATLMDYIDSNESGILYNIQGHRVLNHERGLLITNGRKILIK